MVPVSNVSVTILTQKKKRINHDTTCRLPCMTSLQHEKESMPSWRIKPRRSYKAPNSSWYTEVAWGLSYWLTLHYGYASTETRNSTTSSRRRRWRRRWRFLCDSHSLPILRRNLRHGIIYQTININSFNTIYQYSTTAA